MMELSDAELGVLQQVLWEEIDANHHEPSRRDEYDQEVASDLYGKVHDEAKRRRLWWVR